MNYLVMTGLAVAVWLFGSYLTPSPKAVLFFNSAVIKDFRKAEFKAGQDSIINSDTCPYCPICESWHYIEPSVLWRPCFAKLWLARQVAALLPDTITRPITITPMGPPFSTIPAELVNEDDDASVREYLAGAAERIERMAEQLYREGQP